MDINMFLLTHKSYFPSRIDFMNNIQQKANSLSEDEQAKIAPVLAMSKFYSPAIMTLLSIPFAIFGVIFILVCFNYASRNIFGSAWIEGGFGVLIALILFIFSLIKYYKNSQAYNYNTLMEILNAAIVDSSFFKAYFSIVFHIGKADANKLEEQNKPKEQQ